MSSLRVGVDLPPDLVEQLDRVRRPAMSSATLPAGCYVDDAAYAREVEVIFRQGWVGVGRSDRWASAGDYATFTLGGVPTIVVRDDHGVLRSYNNSCSHRSSQIMEGEGSCTRMRCRFHFWTYGLDGRLLAAPSMNRTPGFDKEAHGLVEFVCEERLGFAFVSFESNPPPIDEWLGDLAETHSKWPLADLRTSRRREFEVDTNWKTSAEVFNEYYHLPYVHPGSIASTYLEPDDGDEVRGNYATHFGPTDGTGGLLDTSASAAFPPLPSLIGEREANGVRYTWIYPNIVFAAGAEGLWMYELYPISPEKTLCAQVVAFPESTLALTDFSERVTDYYERFDVAIAEDIPMLEEQQIGLNSPFAKQGRYSYLEPSVAQFACWYADRMLARVR